MLKCFLNFVLDVLLFSLLYRTLKNQEIISYVLNDNLSYTQLSFLFLPQKDSYFHHDSYFHTDTFFLFPLQKNFDICLGPFFTFFLFFSFDIFHVLLFEAFLINPRSNACFKFPMCITYSVLSYKIASDFLTFSSFILSGKNGKLLWSSCNFPGIKHQLRENTPHHLLHYIFY